jgi:hypothetical protein
MLILWPDIHRTLTSHVARMMKVLGHQVIIPDKTYKIEKYPEPPIQNWCWNESYENGVTPFGSNVRAMSKDEILNSPIDAICIPNVESQWELRNLAIKIPKVKLFYYTGNDYFKGHLPYSDGMKNIIFADQSSKRFSEEGGVPNRAEWIPFIHSDNLFKSNTSLELYSYISSYKSHFKQCFDFFQKLRGINQMFIIENIQDKTSEFVKQKMINSSGIVHIKPIEGMGFSTLEAVSLGRPVFAHRTLSNGKSLLRWVKQGRTGMFFENGADFKEILDIIQYAPEVLIALQQNTYKESREIINSSEQIEILKCFLERLI